MLRSMSETTRTGNMDWDNQRTGVRTTEEVSQKSGLAFI